MSHAADLPLWAAVLASCLLLFGAALALIGSAGLFYLKSFYERIHAPTLGTSWGTGGVVLASMITFSALDGRPVLHELLIGAFVTVTTPVTLMLLARASLYRDRAAGSPEVLGRVSGASPAKQAASGRRASEGTAIRGAAGGRNEP